MCPGEAYDKVARLLGLELRPSGGAAVEAFANEGDDQRFKFSMPLRMRPNCNFSYAGLKTAVRLAIEAEAPGPATDANRQVTSSLCQFILVIYCLFSGVRVRELTCVHVCRTCLHACYPMIPLGHSKWCNQLNSRSGHDFHGKVLNFRSVTITLTHFLKPAQVRADIAASFQRVALTHLQERTQRAAGWAMEAEPGIRHLVVAGGVAANKLLRSKLQVML